MLAIQVILQNLLYDRATGSKIPAQNVLSSQPVGSDDLRIQGPVFMFLKRSGNKTVPDIGCPVMRGQVLIGPQKGTQFDLPGGFFEGFAQGCRKQCFTFVQMASRLVKNRVAIIFLFDHEKAAVLFYNAGDSCVWVPVHKAGMLPEFRLYINDTVCDNTLLNGLKFEAAGILMSELTHLDDQGRAQMVDVGAKDETQRSATAEAVISMQPDTLAMIVDGKHKKGDVFAVARIAGIQAAKKCPDLIPLCHPLMLSAVNVELEADTDNNQVLIRATCKLKGQTGVEMEALTAASVAALTVYDMCKAVDRGMIISQVRLLEKAGGKSGNWSRTA